MIMSKVNTIVVVVILHVVLFTSCTSGTNSPEQIHEIEHENSAVITDRTGRDWDVTHARDVYGMNPDYFNFGLGIGAISSVDDPIVLKEGDSGYLSSDNHIQVFSVNHNGKQRAYSVNALIQHEVFNDVYPGESNQYLAITY